MKAGEHFAGFCQEQKLVYAKHNIGNPPLHEKGLEKFYCIQHKLHAKLGDVKDSNREATWPVSTASVVLFDISL